MSPTPLMIVALPFPWPTRLAVGLELEVFYTKHLAGLVIRPVFRKQRNIGSPVSFAIE